MHSWLRSPAIIDTAPPVGAGAGDLKRRTPRRLPAALTRMLLALIAVLAIPLGLPASAHANPGPGPVPGPDTVTVGVYINDLQDIELSSENFTADIYLWMKWKNPKIDPSTTIESMNSQGYQNTTSSPTGGLAGELTYQSDTGASAPVDLPDGSKYQVLRYQGVFSRKMSLKKYPFDTQVIEMVFEDKVSDSTQLQYVPDTNPITVNDSGSMTIPGYVFGKPSLQVVGHKYPTNFGDPRANADTPYSRIIVALPVTRDVLPYLVKIVLPIFIVVLITALIYLLPARLEESRTDIGVIAMLTLVALQWNSDSSLPSVEYLTLMDIVYIISMVYVLAAMAYAVLASRRNRAEMAEALSVSLDRRVGIISLLAYLAILAITLIYYLNQHYNVLNQYV